MKRAKEFNVDPDKIVIIGDSAGSNNLTRKNVSLFTTGYIPLRDFKNECRPRLLVNNVSLQMMR